MHRILLAAVFIFFGSYPAFSTECEKDDVVREVYNLTMCNDMGNCAILKDATPEGMEKYYQNLLQLLNESIDKGAATNGAIKEAFDMSRNAIRELVDAYPTSAAISNHHAIDYQPEIGRYTCGATVTIDPAKIRSILHSALYLKLLDFWFAAAQNGQKSSGDTIVDLISELANNDDTMKMKKTIQYYQIALDKSSEGHYDRPFEIEYTVQQTEKGKFVKIQKSIITLLSETGR